MGFQLMHMKVLLKDDNSRGHSQGFLVCHARDNTERGSSIEVIFELDKKRVSESKEAVTRVRNHSAILKLLAK